MSRVLLNIRPMPSTLTLLLGLALTAACGPDETADPDRPAPLAEPVAESVVSPTDTLAVVERWTLRPEREAAGLRFGRSVAISGDLVVVGATGDATNGTLSGAAYVFEKTADGWSRAKLVPPDGEPEARFGWGVATDGDRVVVSAPWATNPVEGRSGTVYLYERAGGAWRPRVLRVSDPEVDAQVGRSLAMGGGRIAAGVYGDDTAAGEMVGSVVIFEETGAGWSDATVRPDKEIADGWFGHSLVADGGRFGVGGYYARQESGPEAGSAYVVERGVDGGWDVTPLAPRVRPARKDHFGRAVAFVGETVFVGAEEDDNANGTNAGGVFAVPLDRSEAEPRLVVPADGQPRTYFGYVLGATDRVLAAYAADEVVVFLDPGTDRQREARLSELMGEPLAGRASAMAGEEQRLVVGMAFADGTEEEAGAVVVVEFAR